MVVKLSLLEGGIWASSTCKASVWHGPLQWSIGGYLTKNDAVRLD